MSQNHNQVGGTHYQKSKIQHWDFAYENEYDIFQVYITKYVHRHKKKNGLEDLLKAQHCLAKYIEVLTEAAAKAEAPGDQLDLFYNDEDYRRSHKDCHK